MYKKYKRRNFFIKKEFQGKLILGYFLFVTVGCLFFILVLGYFSADTLTIAYSNNDLQLGQTPIMLLKKTLTAHWIFIILGAVVTVIGAMLITHRIAGPLFRLEKALGNMLNKNLADTIYLRSKDEGQELATQINLFNQELSATVKMIHFNSSAIAELLERAKGLSKGIPAEQLEEMKSIYWSVEEKNKKILAECASYTLKDE